MAYIEKFESENIGHNIRNIKREIEGMLDLINSFYFSTKQFKEKMNTQMVSEALALIEKTRLQLTELHADLDNHIDNVKKHQKNLSDVLGLGLNDF